MAAPMMYGGASQDDIANRRKLANTLLTQGMSTAPVQHWTQGLARVLQGGVGGMHQDQARQSEKDMADHLSQAMQSGKYDIPSLLSNPLGRPFAFNLAQMQAEQNTPMAQARLKALEQETAQGAERHPLQLDQMRAGTAASRASAASTVGAERRASELHPLDIEMRRKQLEAAKVGKAREDEYLYVPDKTQPGGVRIIQPAAGAGGQKKFNEEAAKSQVERYTKHVEAGDLAERSAVDMQTLRQLSDKVGDPSISNTLTRTLGPYARALGVDITNMGQVEAFTAVVSRLAPNMRPPGSGATSDFEFKQYLASLPALAQTSEGRRLIMDQFDVFSQHALAKREIAAKVLNGDIDRREGDRLMQRLPDPLALWKQTPTYQEMQRRSGRGGAAPQQGGQPQQGAAQPLPSGTYQWNGQALQSADGQTFALPDAGAAPAPRPQQSTIDPNSPAGLAQAQRAQRQQQQQARQAEARGLIDQEFQRDMQAMDPLSFARKYDQARRFLTPEQIRTLNEMIARAERGGGQ